jgi:hypothetical protein
MYASILQSAFPNPCPLDNDTIPLDHEPLPLDRDTIAMYL